MAVWDITSYTYSGTSLDVSGAATGPNQPFLKDDGTKLFVCDFATDRVLEYALSTAWDVSSGSFTTSFDYTSQVVNANGLAFGNSGAKMYLTDVSSADINEYTLSTAWDVSSASFVQSFSVAAQETAPRNVAFNTAGTKMFVAADVSAAVLEYSLSTAWDISTASYVDSLSLGTQPSNPFGIAFGDSGLKLYVSDTTDIYQYDLSTAFDVSTGVYAETFDTTSETSSALGLFFRPNGDNFYLAGNSTDSVLKYVLITAISATATIAGTSTLVAIPAVISGISSIAGDGVLSGVGATIPPAPSRAVDEASAGGTSAALSVSLNSAITEPANPSGNT